MRTLRLCLSEETAVRRYLGGDVHSTTCTFAQVSADGKRLRQDVIETNGRALIEYVRSVPGEVHLCIEEGELSQWLYELLSPEVAEMTVIRPDKRRGSKNDRLDAFGLGRQGWKGELDRAVYKSAHSPFRALREYARVYGRVRQDLVRTKNRLKHFYRSRGLGTLGEAVFDPTHRSKVLSRLPQWHREALGPLYAELDQLEALRAEAERAMVRESHRHPIARILETAPGFGEVRVAELLPIVITPHRFRTARQFWSYVGLGIVTRSSNDWVPRRGGGFVRGPVIQTRGLTLAYNRRLQGIFKGAATTVIQRAKDEPLREDYQRLLAHGIKPNLAKLTIARKLAAIVLVMWKREERYQPEVYRRSRAA
jgi:transposase